MTSTMTQVTPSTDSRPRPKGSINVPSPAYQQLKFNPAFVRQQNNSGNRSTGPTGVARNMLAPKRNETSAIPKTQGGIMKQKLTFLPSRAPRNRYTIKSADKLNNTPVNHLSLIHALINQPSFTPIFKLFRNPSPSTAVTDVKPRIAKPSKPLFGELIPLQRPEIPVDPRKTRATVYPNRLGPTSATPDRTPPCSTHSTPRSGTSSAPATSPPRSPPTPRLPPRPASAAPNPARPPVTAPTQASLAGGVEPHTRTVTTEHPSAEIPVAHHAGLRVPSDRPQQDPLEIALAAIFESEEQEVRIHNAPSRGPFLTPPPVQLQIAMASNPQQPMDIGPPPAKSARTDISDKFLNKSEANRAKKNPNKPEVKEDDFVVQPLGRKYGEPKNKRSLSASFSQIPTLTLRMLMPGDSKDADKEDRRMDQTFKQEKVEFLLVARPVTQTEIDAGYITESVNSSEWDIPEIEDFEDCMGQAVNAICKSNIKLIHQVQNLTLNCNTNMLNTLLKQVQWSSVASQTGIGAFSVRTDDMVALENLRTHIRGLVLGTRCFESFPKDALLKKYGLTIYFPRACAHMDPDLLIEVLRECNPGLKGPHISIPNYHTSINNARIQSIGLIETIDCKIFKDTNPNIRRRGVKIISFTGDEAFLDSLHSFPANFPFSVKLANCYIRGGDRVKERYTGATPQRPKMAMSAVRELLRRNSTTITNEALDEEDRLASGMRETNIEGTNINNLSLNNPESFLHTRTTNLTAPTYLTTAGRTGSPDLGQTRKNKHGMFTVILITSQTLSLSLTRDYKSTNVNLTLVSLGLHKPPKHTGPWTT